MKDISLTQSARLTAVMSTVIALVVIVATFQPDPLGYFLAGGWLLALAILWYRGLTGRDKNYRA